MTTEKTIISVPPRDQPETDSANAWIVLIYGGDLGKRFQITTETTVGRGDSNSVVLDMPNVSRHHARFFFKEGGFLVEDLGSTNGTFVNDTEILDQHTLSNGDLITTGGAVFKFIFGGNVEALYHEEIYRLAILDGLTGVHNKRFLATNDLFRSP